MSDAIEEFMKGFEQFLSEDHAPKQLHYYFVYNKSTGEIFQSIMDLMEATPGMDYGCVEVSKETYETPGIFVTHMVKDGKVIQRPDERNFKFLKEGESEEFGALSDNMFFVSK